MSKIIINNNEYNIFKEYSFNFIEISYKIELDEKIDYIKKNLSDTLKFDKHIDGIIIIRDSNYETFYEVFEKYNGVVKMIYINRNIIVNRFHGVGYTYASLWFNHIVGNYHRIIPGDGVNLYPYSTFLSGKSKNYIIPSFTGIIPIGRLPPFENIPTLVYEISFCKRITAGFEKSRLYLNIPGIIFVFYIIIGSRDATNGTWKGFAFLFNRTVDFQNPTIAISFGTRPSSIKNENKVRDLSCGNSQLTGFLSPNNQSNLLPNNPPFIINIQPNILFSGVSNDQLALQNKNLEFDLFHLKNEINEIKNFYSLPSPSFN